MAKGKVRTGADATLTRVEALCLKRGIRMSTARRTIAKLLSATSDHPDVEKIYERLRKVDDTISRASIYTTMTLFVEKNIVVRRNFGDGRARF